MDAALNESGLTANGPATRGARLIRWLAAPVLLDPAQWALLWRCLWRLVASLGEKADGRVEEEDP